MPSDIPLLFGEIGLELGFYTPESLDECIRLQEEATFHRHIGSILLEQKHISFAQLNQILKAQKERLAQPPNYSDLPRNQILFGRLVLIEKMATEKQVNAALREQGKLASAGTYTKIGQVLRTLAGLTPADIEKVLYTQGKAIFACPECQTQHNVVSSAWSEPPECSQCNVELEGIEQPAETDAWDELDRLLPEGAAGADALPGRSGPQSDEPAVIPDRDTETLSLGELGVPDLSEDPTEEIHAVKTEAAPGAAEPVDESASTLDISADTMQKLYEQETLGPQLPDEEETVEISAGEDEIVDLTPREFAVPEEMVPDAAGAAPVVGGVDADTLVQDDSAAERAGAETVALGGPAEAEGAAGAATLDSGVAESSRKSDLTVDTVLEDSGTAVRAAMETIAVAGPGGGTDISGAGTISADEPEAAAARSAYIEKKEEVAFGKIAKEKGFVTEDHVLTAIAIREERTKEGLISRLSEIMIEREMINPGQLQEIMAEQEKYALQCPHCHSHYPVSIHEKDQPFTCPDCNAGLVGAEKAAEVMSAQETIDSSSHIGTLVEEPSAEKFFQESCDLTAEETREIRPDLLFGKVALEYGFTTRDRVIECARDQETTMRDKKIGEIMVGKGYLSDDEVVTILDLQRKSLELAPEETKQRKDQILFGRLLIAEGLVTEDQLREALKEKTRREQLGTKIQLGRIFVEQGIITVEQAQDMLYKQGKEILICPKCFSQYNVRFMDEKNEIRCKIDGTLLTVPTHLRDIAADSSAALVTPGSRFGTAEEIEPRLDSGHGPDSATAETIRFSSVQDAPPGPSFTDEKEELAPSGRKMFERYEILGELARGGMGIVYRAVHPALKRVVALKVLLAGEHATEDQIRRFHQEAESAAKLKHPNIVPIHDVGIYKGKHYFTLEFIEGKTLRDKIREERISVEEAMQLMRDVCDAIHYAHERGIIHRDLKPANIMIDHLGNPQVMDFGLAKNIEGESRTITGVIMGTPAYMPPEQAEGKISILEGRSDIYSLGAVFYECLTGSPPFEGANPMEVIKKVIEDDPAPPRSLNARIPRDAETICMVAMEKKMSRRYSSALTMKQDIERFLSGDPIQARPQSIIYKGSKWVKKRRGLVAAIVIILLLIAAAITSFSVWRHQKYQKAVADFDTKMALAKTCVQEAQEIIPQEEGDFDEQIDKYKEAVGYISTVQGKFDENDTHFLKARDELRKVADEQDFAERARRKFTADKDKIKNTDILYTEAKALFDDITSEEDGKIALWRAEQKKAKGERDTKKLREWRRELRRVLKTVARKASSSYDQLPDEQKKARAEYKALAFDANRTLAEFELDRLAWDSAEDIYTDMQSIRFDLELEIEGLTDKQNAFNVEWDKRCAAIIKRIRDGRDINNKLNVALEEASGKLLSDPLSAFGDIEAVLDDNDYRIRNILARSAYAAKNEEVNALLAQAKVRQAFLEARKKAVAEEKEKMLRDVEVRAGALKGDLGRQIREETQNLLTATRRELFKKYFPDSLVKQDERQADFNTGNAKKLEKHRRDLVKAREYLDEKTNSADARLVDELILRVENALAPHEGMAYVDAGNYYVGTDAKNTDRHWMDGVSSKFFGGFYIGVNEVTNDEFLAFVKNGGYEKPEFWRPEVRNRLSEFTAKDGNARGPATWTAGQVRIKGKYVMAARPSEGEGSHPVTGICFYEADAFCAWKTIREGAKIKESLAAIEEKLKTAKGEEKKELEGRKKLLEHHAKSVEYRLPDELEWEVAARGNTRSAYPWGPKPSPGSSNIAENGQIVPVDDGKFVRKDYNEFFGTCNMAGNAFEWTVFNPAARKGRSGAQDGGPAVGVIRGGSVGFDIEIAERFARIPNRKLPSPFYRNPKFGFRMACNVPNYFKAE